MRVLVTGSRDWPTPEAVIHELDAALEHEFATCPVTEVTVVHGACPRGADQHAADWCEAMNDTSLGQCVYEERHPADWDRYGKAAGFRRNAEMVALGADVCLAFIHNGSRGASHTADLAEKAGIPTRRFTA